MSFISSSFIALGFVLHIRIMTKYEISTTKEYDWLGEKILSHIFRQKLDYFSVKYFRSSFISRLPKNCKAHFFIVFPREEIPIAGH